MAERSVALADCGRWLSGGTPATEEPRFWGGPIPWITASSLKSKRLTSSGRTLTPEGARAGSRIVPAGTLIFVVRGMSLKKEFRVGIAGTDVAFGQDCKALMPRPGLLPEYLYYALIQSSDNVLRCVDESSHGTGRLETKALGNVRIRVPPPAEQHRIAEILDTVDETIRSTARLVAKLERMKRGLLHDLLTRGIDDNGAPRDPGSHPEQFRETALGRLPREWTTARLKDFCGIRSGATPPRQSESIFYSLDGVPWVKTLDLNEDRLTDTDEHVTELALKYASCPLLHPGTVLVAMYGGWAQIGRTALLGLDATTNQAICGLSIRDQTHPAFLLRALQHGRNRWKAVAASTRKDPNITKQDVADFLVPIPPPAEQLVIVECFDQHLDLLRRESDTLDKLKPLKAGLMDDLLTGRVRAKVENEHAA